jgi:hypothetical protein
MTGLNPMFVFDTSKFMGLNDRLEELTTSMEILFAKDGQLETFSRSFGCLMMNENTAPIVVEPFQTSNRENCQVSGTFSEHSVNNQ